MTPPGARPADEAGGDLPDDAGPRVPGIALRRWVAVMWPAFLAACVIEIVVFAGFDPADFHAFGGTTEWSREGVLTIAFLAFWVITSLAGYATWRLADAP